MTQKHNLSFSGAAGDGRITYRAAAIPDTCKLLTPAEIKSALGSEPTPGKVDGPKVGKEPQATTSGCSMLVGEVILGIGLAEFATPAAAHEGFTMMTRGGAWGVPES